MSARHDRGCFGEVRKPEVRTRAYTMPQNIYQTCPNRLRSLTETHGVPRTERTNVAFSHASAAPAGRTRVTPALLSATPDAGVPHVSVRSSKSTS